MGTDRIIEFQFSDGQYRLFLEFFSGGNIILTDQEFTILAVLRNVPASSGQEEIRLGLKYTLEDKQHYHGVPELSVDRLRIGLETYKAKISGEDQVSRKKSKKKRNDEIRRALADSFHEFPPPLIDHVLRSESQESLASVDELLKHNDDLQRIYKSLEEADTIRQNLTRGTECEGFIVAKSRAGSSELEQRHTGPDLTEEPNQTDLLYEDFQPFSPDVSADSGLTRIAFSNFNKTVDQFFSSVESQTLETRISEREEHAKRKLETAKKDHEKRLDGLQQVQELNVRRAQAIENNLDRVEEAMSAINSLIAQGIGWPEIARMIELEQKRHNAVAEMVKLPLKLYENTVTLLLAGDIYEDEPDFEGETTDSEVSDDHSTYGGEAQKANVDKTKDQRIPVDIDLGVSPWSNARQYYDQKRTAAVKEEKTMQASSKALKSTQNKINADLKKGLSQEKDLMRPQRKAAWFEKFLFFISSEGYLVLGGRDVQQSEILYNRYLKKGDVYVHADLSGASSVIVKNLPGRSMDPIPPSTLSQAGNLAVCTSSAWDSKAVMSAWWVSADSISKTAPNGDYLQPGSFQVKGSKNFLPPAQLLLGFGIMFKISSDSKARHQKHRVTEDQTPEKDSKADMDDDHTSEQGQEEKLQSPEPPEEDENAANEEEIGHMSEGKLEEGEESDSEEFESEAGNEEDHTVSNPLQPDAETTRPQGVIDVAESTEATSGYEAENDVNEDPAQATDEEPTQSTSPTVDDGLSKAGHQSAGEQQLMHQGVQNPATDASSETLPTPTGDNAQKATPTSAQKQRQVRGKQGKKQKLKTKYADQDDEDRALAMRLLGSSAAQEKAKEDATTKQNKEQENAAAKERRRKQHQVAMEKGKKAEELRRLQFEKSDSKNILGGRDDDDGEATAEQQLQEEDLECFVGSPLPRDDILDALVVCGPWDAIGRKCKWRVKIQPGAMKKGKAVKEILRFWNMGIVADEKKKQKTATARPHPHHASTTYPSDVATTDTAPPEGASHGEAATTATNSTSTNPLEESEKIKRREVELIKGIRDTEVVGIVPVSKMRAVLSGGGGGSGGQDAKGGKGKGKGGGSGGGSQGNQGKRGGRGSKKK